ncbi:WD repeat-containing protein 55-like [Mizuhopecten yessoensis]|uniref:WD repeat-containing protein 55-like n=1 Tax=Mizuhopecten yessoensis TaxID=6573 RepID=UPI000B45E6E4|nr:WD repeat-containing protein 55-like [Mizuhopecten yessoensis]
MATKDADLEKPKDIKFDGVVVDICFHPSKDVIAAGDIDGEVSLHSYSASRENSTLMSFKNHKKACRALRFSANGEELYTASKDKSIHVVDMNTGALKRKLKKAHESPIYSMLVTGENFLATGDDDGHLKVWDLRTNRAEMEVKHNEEFISDMEIDDQHKILITTRIYRNLSVHEPPRLKVRRKRMDIQSELFDSELLSLARLKEKEKIVCGTGEGVLNIFNWGEWGNISDRFPGHPMSVDCMVAVTDNILCTGSSDGIVRAVNILPNRFLGVLGDHDEFPVENLSLSHDGNLLASCSHDQTIKFWNTSDFRDLSVSTKKRAKKGNKPNKLGSTAKNDFFADLADDNADDEKDTDKNEDESDEGDSDDDDDDDDDVE